MKIFYVQTKCWRYIKVSRVSFNRTVTSRCVEYKGFLREGCPYRPRKKNSKVCLLFFRAGFNINSALRSAHPSVFLRLSNSPLKYPPFLYTTTHRYYLTISNTLLDALSLAPWYMQPRPAPCEKELSSLAYTRETLGSSESALCNASLLRLQLFPTSEAETYLNAWRINLCVSSEAFLYNTTTGGYQSLFVERGQRALFLLSPGIVFWEDMSNWRYFAVATIPETNQHTFPRVPRQIDDACPKKKRTVSHDTQLREKDEMRTSVNEHDIYLTYHPTLFPGNFLLYKDWH